MVSRTVLETNFNALEHNVNIYKSFLGRNTKFCAVIKATGYGSSAIELAKFYEQIGVDYLAVAYTYEGVELRENGITKPILVFNPEIDFFKILLEYNLEPTFYDFSQFEKFKECDIDELKIHLKLDTGMHRLGFEESQIDKLLQYLESNKKLKVASIFSHLAASEDKEMDNFTYKQILLFEKMYDKIQSVLSYNPMRHILNSAGIIRFPEAHFDMVRLGIGMHGDDTSDTISKKLKAVHTLKTKIIQIKLIKPGEGIGYGIRYKKNDIRKIAIIPLGYADGLFRLFGNKNNIAWVNGAKIPFVGNVSMDTCFIDVSSLENVKTGDEVEIFGSNISLQECARSVNTISYEILSRIAPRVRRVYVR